MQKQKFDAAELSKIATKVRIGIIESVYAAGSGHVGGALGIADILTYLYFQELNIDPISGYDAERDRFILSPAHMVPGLYSVLAQRGFFPVTELATLRDYGSRLQGHTFRNLEIGVETTGGSLAQGLSIACGSALAARLNKSEGGREYRTYCVISDGELNEGQMWEALMFAAKFQLNNLCIILDRNHIQQSNSSNEIMPLEPLRAKLEAFNLHVLEIDGHDFAQIEYAIQKSKLITLKPTLVLANTTAGKGVSFMEGNYEWHSKGISPEDYQLAITDLENDN